jgi:hypothetical protein
VIVGAGGDDVGVDVARAVRRNGEGVDCSGGTQGLTPTIGSGGLGSRVSGGPMHRIVRATPASAAANRPKGPRTPEGYAGPRDGA